MLAGQTSCQQHLGSARPPQHFQCVVNLLQAFMKPPGLQSSTMAALGFPPWKAVALLMPGAMEREPARLDELVV